jgi:hypothetical protein
MNSPNPFYRSYQLMTTTTVLGIIYFWILVCWTLALLHWCYCKKVFEGWIASWTIYNGTLRYGNLIKSGHLFARPI